MNKNYDDIPIPTHLKGKKQQPSEFLDEGSDFADPYGKIPVNLKDEDMK